MDKIISYLTSKGFNNKQIDKILNNYAIRQYKNYDLLLSRIQNSIGWLESFHYAPNEIVHMCNEIPNILCIDKDVLQSKVDCLTINGFNEEQIFKCVRKCPHVLSYSVAENIQPLFDYIKTFNITDEELTSIFAKDPKLFSVSADQLKKRILRNEELKIGKDLSIKILKKAPSAYNIENNIPNRLKAFRKLGIINKDKSINSLEFSEEEVLKIVSRFPVALTYAPSTVNTRITYLAEQGFSADEIRKMILASPPLLSCGKNTIKNHIKFFERIGYSKEETLKILSDMPSQFNLTLYNIKNKFTNMQRQGFSRDIFRLMTISHASLLNLSPELMNEKLKSLRDMGFNQKELVYITSASPNLITSSIEKTKDKIEYLRSIGLGSIITKTPSNLTTSTATIYARREFFKTLNPPIFIDENHYANLFITWRNFKKRFGKTKEELLRDYNYEEYKNRRGGEIDDEDDKNI